MPVRALERLVVVPRENSGHRSRVGKFFDHIDGEQLERQDVHIPFQAHRIQEEEREGADMGNGDGDNGKIHHEDLGIAY
jgi:hypothetical protein